MRKIIYFFIFLSICILFILPRKSNLFFLLSPSQSPAAFTVKGIGVIGDSLSDEYQADDMRGYEFSPTTLNWIEQLVKSRNLNFGVWGKWGDVRRNGFAYNWAQTSFTTDDVLKENLDHQVARQVQAGEINVVILYIGANDFFPLNEENDYKKIYYNLLSDKEQNEKIDRTVKHIERMADTIQQAGDVRIMVMGIPDWNLSPPLRVIFPDESKRVRVSKVIGAINNRLQLYAQKKGLFFVDTNVFYSDLLTKAPFGSIMISGESVNIYLPGDEPHHGFLSDIIHPGSVINGLFANYMLEHMNTKLETKIPLLSEDEIARNAGLGTRQ